MQARPHCNRKKGDVYVYARWSCDGQTNGDSLRRQVEMAEKWCVARGLTLADCTVDAGVSAWRGKNHSDGSGLARLLKRIQPRDYLLVENVDRLSRENWLDHMNFLRQITDKGCIVVTLADGREIDAEKFKTDPGTFLPAILAAHLANDENQKKSQRIKESWRARYARLAKGQAANLRLPCWLSWDKDADKPVLNKINVPVIRQMFSLSLGGMGAQTIARLLFKQGRKLIVGKRELTLSGPFVWRVLRNPLCIGTSTYTTPHRPKVFPAVVDDAIFYAVQRRLEINKHETRPRSGGPTNLFMGICRCSKCGGTLVRFTQCRGIRRYRYLVCSNSYHGHGKCGMTSIRYDVLERSFLHLLGQTDLVRQAMIQQQPGKPNLMDTLTGQAADTQRQIGKLMALILNDPSPSANVYRAIKDAEAKLEELHRQIEAERSRQLLESSTPLDSYDRFCREFEGRMAQPQYREAVRSKLHAFVECVTVQLGKDRYAVRFKGVNQPVEVTLNRDGWAYSPAPAWMFGRPIPECGNVIG